MGEKRQKSSQIEACEQKTNSKNANFWSNITAKRAFLVLFLFRRDQNHHLNLTSKNENMRIDLKHIWKIARK